MSTVGLDCESTCNASVSENMRYRSLSSRVVLSKLFHEAAVDPEESTATGEIHCRAIDDACLMAAKEHFNTNADQEFRSPHVSLPISLFFHTAVC